MAQQRRQRRAGFLPGLMQIGKQQAHDAVAVLAGLAGFFAI